jgi:hypothetical protein
MKAKKPQQKTSFETRESKPRTATEQGAARRKYTPPTLRKRERLADVTEGAIVPVSGIPVRKV